MRVTKVSCFFKILFHELYRYLNNDDKKKKTLGKAIRIQKSHVCFLLHFNSADNYQMDTNIHILN